LVPVYTRVLSSNPPPPIPGRQAGIELFRILSLLDAHQHHLYKIRGFFNAPTDTWYWQYYLIVVSSLGFTMTGLLQLGTLFGLRSPFRAKGLTMFILTLVFYGRAVTTVLAFFGFSDRRGELWARFPIISCFSWFFTSHTILTLLTSVLNPGIVSLSRYGYRFVAIGIIVMILSFRAPGMDILGDGLNWMNAVFLYVFAGYFGVHGWPVSGICTWIPFLVLMGASRYLVSHDVFGMVSPRWHWVVLPFRLVVFWMGSTVEFAPTGCRAYICPLSYLWGPAALYAFRSLGLPSGVSKMITFIGAKVFMVHWFDTLHAYYGRELQGLLRPFERRMTPSGAFDNAVLTSVQFMALGGLLEMYRDRVFQFLLNTLTVPVQNSRAGSWNIWRRSLRVK
jgi:hypothetical protein